MDRLFFFFRILFKKRIEKKDINLFFFYLTQNLIREQWINVRNIESSELENMSKGSYKFSRKEEKKCSRAYNIICVTLSRPLTKPNKELNEFSPKKVMKILFVHYKIRHYH